jgi:Ca2+-dependent lipid-binding protein
MCYRLLVHVDKVEHLPPKGEHYTYSVVVKLIILPLNKPVHVSRIYKHDLNPVIEEDFEFTVKHPLGKVLRLSLYDADYQGKYDAIGHALLCLEDVMAEKFRRYSLRLYKQSQVSNCQLSFHLKRTIHSSTSINCIPL